MDSFTHAVSGVVALLACPRRPATRWAAPLAALAASFPDVDVFFSRAPLDFLLLHRGITHSLFVAPLLGLLLAGCMYPLWRADTPGRWTFPRIWLFAVALLLLHIWLDCVTTYGTMIFLPFSDYRVRLNGLFIVDMWLLLPMVAALVWGRSRRELLVAALLWAILYPGFCVGLRRHHQLAAEQRLEDLAPRDLNVLPDAFAPLFWRVVYRTDTPMPATPHSPPTPQTIHEQGLDLFGRPWTPVHDYPAADAALVRRLTRESRSCQAFFSFSLRPIQEVTSWEGGTEYTFYDLRFATLVPVVQKGLALRRHGSRPFLLLARVDHGGKTDAVRMIFSGSGRDSGWRPPLPSDPPDFWHWLVGLR